MQKRLRLLPFAAAALFLAGCASTEPVFRPDQAESIVFVPGNGDSAAVWQTTLWRFESNGWPRQKLHAINMPYPLARDDDNQPQAGRTSTAEEMAYLKSEIDAVLKENGASKLILVGNSRGGYAIRNYIQNDPDGARIVSKAILGGTPNHGVWAIPGYNEGSEFSGTGPFLTALNAPKNAAGDEVTGPVKWLTIRSEDNDKYANPDGVWIGKKGTPTNVSASGPALQGATNVAIPRIDHRETAFSAPAFDADWRFITGAAPTSAAILKEARIELGGVITGMGLNPADPASGDYPDNLPLPAARLEIYPVSGVDDDSAGRRLGDAAYSKAVGSDGKWGPFTAQPNMPYEFVISAPGYATTHIYRSPLPRSSNLIHMRPERIAAADKGAKEIVVLTRPRGFLDAGRDRMRLDGKLPPGLPPTGAGLSTSKLLLNEDVQRGVIADFNGERIVGRTWPAAEGHVVYLEITQ
jgi:triacylglycerol lipase